jgi:putative ABC transport system permease protein
MKRLMFYLRYAVRSLRRDSTRNFLAGLSVAFGVLSLISMQLLANALLHGSMFDQRIQYGGDAQIQPASEQGFNADDLAQIEQWQQDGLIADYTLVSNGSGSFLRTPSSGRVTYLPNALGIDPATYPLLGELLLREPAGMSAADVLRNPTDVLITRDLADQRGLHVGDAIILSGLRAPVQLTIVGIVGVTPSQQGDTVYYSLETARMIEQQDDVINSISVTWGTVPNAEQIIVDSPFRVYVAVVDETPEQVSSSTSLFEVMLKGSGVLGLLVGGISVSNTLQVILARRKLEIAMLKTLGYRQGDLLALISLETGLIGLIGGIVGAFVGALIAGKLLDILSVAGSLMLDWRPDPVIVGGGVAVGVLTAVVFGMQAILASSATRPVQLLRELPLATPLRTQIGRWGLYIAMLLVFGVLVGVVLGSLLEGVLYVVVGGLILIVLRTVFWVLLWILLKLPLPPIPVVRLARANLRQRKAQASLAVIALFAGAFSVTFAALIIYNAQSTFGRLRGSDEGYNLMIETTAEDADDAISHMILQGAQQPYITQRTQGTLNGEVMTIEGRDSADLNKDMAYEGSWPESENVGLLPEVEAERYAVGDSLTLDIDGQEQRITVAGFYTVNWDSISPFTGVIIPSSLIERLSEGQFQTRVVGRFPAETLSEVTTTLGETLPQMLVISRADLNDAGVVAYQALFTFAVSVAGLAFVAGAVLIANAAGLTVVERRREIGVFKAVGYTSGHVLRALLSEYGILGVFSGLLGIIGSVVAILAINILEPVAQLTIEPRILAIMLLLSVVIAVVSAGLVAWHPTRVRPLDVLRYE